MKAFTEEELELIKAPFEESLCPKCKLNADGSCCGCMKERVRRKHLMTLDRKNLLKYARVYAEYSKAKENLKIANEKMVKAGLIAL